LGSQPKHHLSGSLREKPQLVPDKNPRPKKEESAAVCVCYDTTAAAQPARKRKMTQQRRQNNNILAKAIITHKTKNQYNIFTMSMNINECHRTAIIIRKYQSLYTNNILNLVIFSGFWYPFNILYVFSNNARTRVKI